jgi:ABC-2 type transport system permease protein
MMELRHAPSKPVTPERALRRLFLMLFLRGRGARGIKKAGAPTSVGRKLATVLLVYTLFGMMALSLAGQTVFALATYLHAMTFILLGLFVATSAGEMLFNREEADILLHRPIAPRALLWAKIGVLVQVSLWLAGALNLAGFFVGAKLKDGGWSFVAVHALSTSLEALFCTATVVMVYQLCLRWFGRERLDALMTTTQVFVSIALVLSGQIVPRLMFRSNGTSLVIIKEWWVGFLPPAWFAGIDDALAGSGARGSWWLALLGVGATALVLWIAFGKLATDYQRGLQTISEVTTRRRTRVKRPLIDRLVKLPPLSWWLRDSVSRASFLLSAAYLARDRDMKLRMYPGMAPMLVLPIIILLPSGQSQRGVGSFGVAFAGGYLGLVPLLALGLLQVSQQWQASDIFRVAPMTGPAALSHGARRAVMALIALPMMLLFCGIVMLVDRNPSHLPLILPGLVALPAYAMYACLGGKGVPLSRAPDEAQAAGRGFSMIGVMISSAVLAGIAAWAYSGGWFPFMLGAEIVLVGGFYYLMRRTVERGRWGSID